MSVVAPRTDDKHEGIALPSPIANTGKIQLWSLDSLLKAARETVTCLRSVTTQRVLLPSKPPQTITKKRMTRRTICHAVACLELQRTAVKYWSTQGFKTPNQRDNLQVQFRP